MGTESGIGRVEKAGNDKPGQTQQADQPRRDEPQAGPRGGAVWALGTCVAVTLLALPLRRWLDPANLVVLYLLPVLFVSARFGGWPGLLSCVLGVLAFDIFMVPPYFSLEVEDTEYLVSFASFLAVALVVSRLTARLRQEAELARQRERATQALFDLSRDLSATSSVAEVQRVLAAHAPRLLGGHTSLVLAGEDGLLRHADGRPPSSADLRLKSAQALFEAGKRGGQAPSVSAAGATGFALLRGASEPLGVLLLALERSGGQTRPLPPELVACAPLLALALERIHFAEAAHKAQLLAESEKLRNAVLAAVSHDLRTPLTAIVGLSNALGQKVQQQPEAHELCQAIEEEALRMEHMAGNLLQLARLQSGAPLDCQWQLLEEVIGSAVQLMQRSLTRHTLEVDIPSDLPQLSFDALLVERVLCNLMANAVRHTPPGTRIRLWAHALPQAVEILVEDEGPGMEEAAVQRLFQAVPEGRPSDASWGLGLTICERIVKAHGGQIHAERRTPRGMRFSFTLPLVSAMDLPDAMTADSAVANRTAVSRAA